MIFFHFDSGWIIKIHICDFFNIKSLFNQSIKYVSCRISNLKRNSILERFATIQLNSGRLFWSPSQSITTSDVHIPSLMMVVSEIICIAAQTQIGNSNSTILIYTKRNASIERGSLIRI